MKPLSVRQKTKRKKRSTVLSPIPSTPTDFVTESAWRAIKNGLVIVLIGPHYSGRSVAAHWAKLQIEKKTRATKVLYLDKSYRPDAIGLGEEIVKELGAEIDVRTDTTAVFGKIGEELRSRHVRLLVLDDVDHFEDETQHLLLVMVNHAAVKGHRVGLLALGGCDHFGTLARSLGREPIVGKVPKMTPDDVLTFVRARLQAIKEEVERTESPTVHEFIINLRTASRGRPGPLEDILLTIKSTADFANLPSLACAQQLLNKMFEQGQDQKLKTTGPYR